MQSDIDTSLSSPTDSRIIRKVIKSSNIESSSDFIVALSEIGNKQQNFLKAILDPIISFEYTNWHDSWESNVNHVFKNIKDSEEDSIKMIESSYEKLLTYFLNDGTITSMYPMDKKDHLGWKLYKEIDEKRLLCKKLLALKSMKDKNV